MCVFSASWVLVFDNLIISDCPALGNWQYDAVTEGANLTLLFLYVTRWWSFTMTRHLYSYNAYTQLEKHKSALTDGLSIL